MGRASKRKKLRRAQRAGARQAEEVYAGLRPTCQLSQTAAEGAASVSRQWCGGSDPEPARLPSWPEDSLGERLFSDVLTKAAVKAPSLRSATIPDPATIASEPAHWEIATWALVRAVVLDGLSVEDEAVATVLRALEVPAVAELADGQAAALEAQSDGIMRAVGVPGFPGDGPVYLLGACALIHATWTVIGEDPLGEILNLLSLHLDAAMPGRGRVLAQALVASFAEWHGCEQEGDAEVLQSLGTTGSDNPLQDLVADGLVEPADALQVGLGMLARLAELCKTGSASVLERVA